MYICKIFGPGLDAHCGGTAVQKTRLHNKYFLAQVFQATVVTFLEMFQTKPGSTTLTLLYTTLVVAGNILLLTDHNSRCVTKCRSNFSHFTNQLDF